MKGKGGVFTESSREMIRDLVVLKVPTMNVEPVIHTVGRGLGREVQDHVSATKQSGGGGRGHCLGFAGYLGNTGK
jgi:hypothetical protein